MPRTARRVLPLIALVAALVVPTSAGAAGIGGAYGDYTNDGEIDACKYSAAELQSILGNVPIDIAQYDPRFVGKLNAALDARASGACAKGKAGSPADAGVAGGSGGGGGDGSPSPGSTPKTTGTPAAAELSSDRGFPTALAVLAALMGLVLLGSGGWALARYYDWDPAAAVHGRTTKLSR